MSSSLDHFDDPFDVVIVGAGAAGLMAAAFAARSGSRVLALDGASKIGAKILISGGGRCNVTHDVVGPDDFNGLRNAIAKVLRSFDVAPTTAFFRELGVTLEREETGKLFPTTNRARTVVDALLRACEDAGAEIRTGARVGAIERGFVLQTSRGPVRASRVILATGGRSVPKTGSDGHGHLLARSFGHMVTATFPALVPLVLERDHWLTRLSGTSVIAELAVRGDGGRILRREQGSMLFTHFGLSGPVVLDISRHWIAASRQGRAASGSSLTANLLPGETFESLDALLVAEARANAHATPASFLRRRLPDRLAEAIGGELGPVGRLTKEQRRGLVRAVIELPLPVLRDRGFDYAEVTAGGVPLEEIDVSTMESRICPGLFLCGEILDVDGKIGGYNFQWAWASGRLAGLNAARR